MSAQPSTDEVIAAARRIVRASQAAGRASDQLTPRYVRGELAGMLGVDEIYLNGAGVKAAWKGAVQEALDGPSSSAADVPLQGDEEEEEEEEGEAVEDTESPPKKAKRNSRGPASKGSGYQNRKTAAVTPRPASSKILAERKPNHKEKASMAESAAESQPAKIKELSPAVEPLDDDSSLPDLDVGAVSLLGKHTFSSVTKTSKNANSARAKIGKDGFKSAAYIDSEGEPASSPAKPSPKVTSKAEPKKRKSNKDEGRSELPKEKGGSKRVQKRGVEPSKEEEEIKRLKSFVFACGVRKKWSTEISLCATPSSQIKHLRKLLEGLGMSGRLSMAKAKEIGERRALTKEIEALGGKRKREEEQEQETEDEDEELKERLRRRQSEKAVRVVGSDEEPNEVVKKRKADFAFLQQSEGESE